ncbi:KamA family radical SAM protein [Fluviispira sanaruensis]|uniref:KamA family radical SAM protein n=1 Tax=Fluviispira sanaruensis TaxID=2493639 RepID=A0A4P2VQ62_FLUSA|nr:KamA family radical SAM protein [Fluviispira sanaruensis]BBH54404.1 KamA family radical SAM protein [Fluviispira sanaruensis]
MPFVTPNELHNNTASNKKNISRIGAKLFGVSEENFTNWRWQMKNQVQSAEDLVNILKISENEKIAFLELKDKFHAGISPYAIALMDFANEFDPVRLQLMPRMEELKDKYGVPDPLNEVMNSPVKEVVHVYKDRIAWCVAQLCPVYCRYCFRKRRDGEEGLHFNPKIIDKGIEYISSNKNIRDVLITGGDPFIGHDTTIENLLKRLREIPHVEIIRFGTRTPVSLPYRITEEFADMLAKYHPIWINTHFNSVQELTPEAASAIDTLLRRGIPVGNQSVFLKDINDSVEKMRALVNGLVRLRARPYYIYHPQIVEGSEHLRIPIEKGLDIMRGLRGSTTGFANPQYVLDTPTGKIPLSPNHVLAREGENVIVEQLNKIPWAEPSPLNGYISERPLPELCFPDAERIFAKNN